MPTPHATLISALIKAEKISDVESAISELMTALGTGFQWAPVGGRQNNRGIIEVATDAGRSLIERVTNACDGILEREFVVHSGAQTCNSPREAAQTWLSVPKNGLSEMSAKDRRSLAQGVQVEVAVGDGTTATRMVSVRDTGIGIGPAEMPTTILSLNESNKISKRHVAGTYGQGGSSTFAYSRYTAIISRKQNTDIVSATIVKFQDLPPDQFKTGNYVYVVDGTSVISAPVSEVLGGFAHGTLVKHIGFDLTGYTGSFNPESVWGLLNRYLFDPILPITLRNAVLGWNRTIKGSRNSLNGAVDEGDDAKGAKLAHSMPMFNIDMREFGSIAIEYWLLEYNPDNETPIRSYVDPRKPIILTNNGQNQGELPRRLIQKESALPYLSGRLIVHINCDGLTAEAKRRLFTSTREQTRSGELQDLIVDQIISSLKSDDDLTRENEEARDRSIKNKSDAHEKQIKSEVSKILRLKGVDTEDSSGKRSESKKGEGASSEVASAEQGGGASKRTGSNSGGGGTPTPIVTNPTPTYVKIVHSSANPIRFYRKQRRAVRLETDAMSDFHDATDINKSRFNFIVAPHLKLVGTSPLRGGRMRIFVECSDAASIGDIGNIAVELTRPGLPILSAAHPYQIIEQPKGSTRSQKANIPEFKIIAVDGKADANWSLFPENSEEDGVASTAVDNDGTLYIYYSTVYPAFKNELEALEKRDPKYAVVFTDRYKIWTAVHSLLIHQDKIDEDVQSEFDSVGDHLLEKMEQMERCRIAVTASMMARREALEGGKTSDED